MTPAKQPFRVKRSEKMAAQLIVSLDRKDGRKSDPFVVKIAEAKPARRGKVATTARSK